MRLAFEQVGCASVFSSDWNVPAQKTYFENFGERPSGDIRSIDSCEIPDHEILVAGFPCQPFSVSGVSKKNSLGHAHGFDDPTQGTLFFEVIRILRDKRPEAFLLENVKNLKSHDRGRTFRIIVQKLQELKYFIDYRVLDSTAHVPQHRERIFIVGFREPRSFDWPKDSTDRRPVLKDILEPRVPEKYTLTPHLWDYLQAYAKKHREAGNGFGYGLANLDGISRTLSARYYKDGSEVLIPQGPGKNPRRLTPRECARLMGFPDSFRIPVSDTQAYKQFGNSVVVPLVASLASAVLSALRERMLEPRTFVLTGS